MEGLSIKIDGNALTISCPGLISKMSLGFTGDKTIMINQISSAQIKKSRIGKKIYSVYYSWNKRGKKQYYRWKN